MNLFVDGAIQQGLSALQAGRFVDAERQFRTVLQQQRHHVGAVNLLSVTLLRMGKYAEAEKYIKLAYKQNPKSEATLNNYGLILKSLNRPKEALTRFSEALGINASAPDTLNSRGTVLSALGRHAEAMADFDRALALQPGYAEAIYNKGNALAKLSRYEDALGCYDKALSLMPMLANAWVGRGNALERLDRRDEALASYDRALALPPSMAEAWIGRGNILAGRKRHDEALAAFDRALAIDRALPDVRLARGLIFADLRQHDDALAEFDDALAVQPDNAAAWFGKGNAFQELRRFADAFAAYDRAFHLKPNLARVQGARLLAKMAICDWNDIDADRERLLNTVRNDGSDDLPTQPFVLLAAPSSSADQLKCAQTWIRAQHPPAQNPLWRGERYTHDRIRIAYLSSDMRDHAIGYLVAGVFESHNRAKFEVTVLSTAPADGSAMRARLETAVERFVDVSARSDDEIAAIVRSGETDILVDLNGLTTGARTNALALRSAPVQINYLGFPGTLGAPYVDYIIADRHLIPEDQKAAFAEKIIYLPDCYQANDSRRVIGSREFTRSELGLPETGFVFCCFNNNYKIMPDVFECWMRILKRLDASVLWLIQDNSTAAANLKKQAANRGIDPARLIFAQRVSLEDHLARHRRADLFLDTLPYNAHTTASDALWTGLPVLTRKGTTFAGRVAASLLETIGLPELVTETMEAYERTAVELAEDPQRLAVLRQKLEKARLTTPLFDTATFALHLEAAFMSAHKRHLDGLAPDHIYIGPES